MKSSLPITSSTCSSFVFTDPRYTILKPIGAGSFAKVYEAEEIKTGKKIALKRFNRAMIEQHLAQNCLREIQILSQLNHPNIVKLDSVFHLKLESDFSVYTTMENIPQDLQSLIYSEAKLKTKQVKKIMYGLIKALLYVHSAGLMHRDIKPANILIDHSHHHIKLCDFGVCRPIIKDLKSQQNDDDIPDENVVIGPTTKDIANPVTFTVGIKSHEKLKNFSKPLRTNRSQSPSTCEYGSCHKRVPSKPKSTFSGWIKSIGLDATPRFFSEGRLTNHLANRWYRAPEQILTEENYNTGVDIWAAGCVFGELLQTLEKGGKDFVERSPLFPGTHCFPQSPLHKNEKSKVNKNLDQITAIFSLLGAQTKEELDFIESKEMKEYAQIMGFYYKKGGLENFLPDVDRIAMDLLKKMLTFNPLKRITAKKALEHEYFKEVRNIKSEIEFDGEIDVFMGSKIEIFAELRKCISKKPAA